MPVIQAKDLYKCYAGFAPVLRGASIEVEAGEMAAIMGPSGCGKSTMLHILGMLHAPDSGSLEILDKDVLKLDREQTAAFRRGNMGFVMQASNLFEHSTVFENVEFPLIYENVPPQERWERVIRALNLVRLSGRVHYRSNRLSGGEQQRVAIARAMVNRPKILLADEPTGALDARTSVLIMENFRKLCHEGGVAMIMVTHDPKMAEYCDSIYTLEDGRLVCKKHEPSPFHSSSGNSFLNPPEPLARGALVATRFPGSWFNHLPLLAARLNDLRLLSRIYSIEGSALGSTPEGYALALPLRQAGLWQRLRALLAFLLHARSSSALWRIWRKFPKTGQSFWKRASIFSRSHAIAAWALQDQTEILYAADAGSAAISVWIAAGILELPFAFSVNCQDVDQANISRPLAEAANFLVCPNQAVLNALQEKLPDLPQEKLLLIRPALSFQADDENMPSKEAGAPAALLTTGESFSRQGTRTVLESATQLMRAGFAFQLSILDEGKPSQRKLVRKSGLDKVTTFYGLPGTEGLAEVYRASDIFIASVPEWPGGDLCLPLSLCEAMACGLAIIAIGNSKALAELLQKNVNCLMVEPQNPSALAEAIKTLARNSDKRKELGISARKAVSSLLNTQAANLQLADRFAMATGLADRKKNDEKDRA